MAAYSKMDAGSTAVQVVTEMYDQHHLRNMLNGPSNEEKTTGHTVTDQLLTLLRLNLEDRSEFVHTGRMQRDRIGCDCSGGHGPEERRDQRSC